MDTKGIALWGFIISCFIILLFSIAGYCFFWRLLSNWKAYNWQYMLFTVIFLILLCAVFLFSRQNLLYLNKISAENIKLRDNYLKEINNTYEGTMKALAYTLDLKDHETWGHSARVVGYAMLIAEKIGLASEQFRQLTWAGILHDIGKVGVPDIILTKKSGLDLEEWDLIKLHPIVGYEIIKKIDFLEFSANIVLLHHENYDGTGYPRGLKGEAIPLEVRIFSIADALDAMTSNRPYRSAKLMEEAITEIEEQAGKQFCPKCVEVLKKIEIEELRKIQQFGQLKTRVGPSNSIYNR